MKKFHHGAAFLVSVFLILFSYITFMFLILHAYLNIETWVSLGITIVLGFIYYKLVKNNAKKGIK